MKKHFVLGLIETLEYESWVTLTSAPVSVVIYSSEVFTLVVGQNQELRRVGFLTASTFCLLRALR